MTNLTIDKTFAEEVRKGLSAKDKSLPSKYFYDDLGDKIFQEIMKMEEYYLTDSEYEILSLQKNAILKAVDLKQPFQLIEFGAGDGFKTKLLLEHFIDQQIDFQYVPIDISAAILNELEADLNKRFPTLKVKPVVNTYFNGLDELKNELPKVILFLGSNIGNFLKKEASHFISQFNERLNVNDKVIVGVDLKKDPNLILNAYNDKKGITSSFNLNLLKRINRELDADFRMEDFKHYPTYNPVTGATKSYLISKKDQKVLIKALDLQIDFKYGEPIFTEVSMKYDIEEIEDLAHSNNFVVVEHFYDCKHYYVNSLWEKKS